MPLRDVLSAVMEDPAAFGRRLRHARVDRGLSQTGLADGFAELLHTVFTTEDVSEYPTSSATGTWITRAQYILAHADPWSRGADPRPVVDNLAVDPLTASTPAALETVELLDAMVRVQEAPDRATVDALTDTLTWTTDAPSLIRRTSLDTVVAVLINAGMPVAAHGAVTRVDPPRISATVAALLSWGGSSGTSAEDFPPVATSRSTRDVAFGVLTRVRDAPELVRDTVADAVVASCPDDGLVTLWAQKI